MSHNEPSKVLSAEDLLAKMREGTKAQHDVQMRGITIPLRVLSNDEHNNVRREAIRLTVAAGGDETDRNLRTQHMVLKLASTSAPNGAPLLGDRLLSLLSVDEVNYIYEEYIRVMDSVNPSLETIDPEVFRALVEALKKNTLSSKDLSLRQLRAMCTAYVDLIQRQEMQNSPQDN